MKQVRFDVSNANVYSNSLSLSVIITFFLAASPVHIPKLTIDTSVGKLSPPVVWMPLSNICSVAESVTPTLSPSSSRPDTESTKAVVLSKKQRQRRNRKERLLSASTANSPLSATSVGINVESIPVAAISPPLSLGKNAEKSSSSALIDVTPPPPLLRASPTSFLPMKPTTSKLVETGKKSDRSLSKPHSPLVRLNNSGSKKSFLSTSKPSASGRVSPLSKKRETVVTSQNTLRKVTELTKYGKRTMEVTIAPNQDTLSTTSSNIKSTSPPPVSPLKSTAQYPKEKKIIFSADPNTEGENSQTPKLLGKEKVEVGSVAVSEEQILALSPTTTAASATSPDMIQIDASSSSSSSSSTSSSSVFNECWIVTPQTGKLEFINIDESLTLARNNFPKVFLDSHYRSARNPSFVKDMLSGRGRGHSDPYSGSPSLPNSPTDFVSSDNVDHLLSAQLEELFSLNLFVHLPHGGIIFKGYFDRLVDWSFPLGSIVALSRETGKVAFIKDNTSPSAFVEHQVSLHLGDHANIVRYNWYGNLPNHRYPHQLWYSVSEYFSQGTLLNLILDRTRPSDWASRQCLFLDLMTGLQFMHSKGVAHRKISPENLFITDDGHLKIGNLDNSVINASPGTLVAVEYPSPLENQYFVAPEINAARSLMHSHLVPNNNVLLADPYKADIFSAGIILYLLKFGNTPWVFADPHLDRNYAYFKRNWTLVKNNWTVLMDARVAELIAGMLSDSSSRWTMDRIFKDEWFKGLNEVCAHRL